MKIGFNIITTSGPKDPNTYKHCRYHPGERLVEIEPSTWRCPSCGAAYLPDEVEHPTKIISKYSKTAPKIMQAKKQRKRRDSLGNKVPDDMAGDLTIGQTIVYYDEQKVSSQSKSN